MASAWRPESRSLITISYNPMSSLPSARALTPAIYLWLLATEHPSGLAWLQGFLGINQISLQEAKLETHKGRENDDQVAWPSPQPCKVGLGRLFPFCSQQGARSRSWAGLWGCAPGLQGSGTAPRARPFFVTLVHAVKSGHGRTERSPRQPACHMSFYPWSGDIPWSRLTVSDSPSPSCFDLVFKIKQNNQEIEIVR